MRLQDSSVKEKKKRERKTGITAKKTRLWDPAWHSPKVCEIHGYLKTICDLYSNSAYPQRKKRDTTVPCSFTREVLFKTELNLPFKWEMPNDCLLMLPAWHAAEMYRKSMIRYESRGGDTPIQKERRCSSNLLGSSASKGPQPELSRHLLAGPRCSWRDVAGSTYDHCLLPKYHNSVVSKFEVSVINHVYIHFLRVMSIGVLF